MRSERRSWLLHRRLAPSVDEAWLRRSAPAIRSNLSRLTAQTHGEPHTRNLKRWSVLLRTYDVGGIRRLLTGLDRDAIEMREVSPLGGLLSDDERRAVLTDARR